MWSQLRQVLLGSILKLVSAKWNKQYPKQFYSTTALIHSFNIQKAFFFITFFKYKKDPFVFFQMSVCSVIHWEPIRRHRVCCWLEP